MPWEFLFDAPDFLAISAFTPVVRYLDLPRGPRPLVVEPPLRILGLVSSPSDYERLDVASERANLEVAVSDLIESGALELKWLEQPTLDALLRTLQQGAFHVLHYVGHGSYDRHSEQGVLLLEDPSGWGRPVSGDKLGTILHDFTSLRLAVLNACEGARTAPNDPFAGVAESLVQREIPAVIAMQTEISDEAAIVFAEGFYSAIADGLPVDAAMAAARLSMFAKRSDDIEWGTPALFMRVPDGRIFELPDARFGSEQPLNDFGGTPASRSSRLAPVNDPPRLSSTAAPGSVPPTLVARSTANAEEDDESPAASASRRPRRRLRLVLTGVGGIAVVAGAVAAIVALSSSSPTSYAAGVTKLCALADSQQRELPGLVRTLSTELTTASTWQQRQEYVLQEVNSRITDAGNLLTAVDSLEPSSTAAASWRGIAAKSIKTTLTALNGYQLNLQSVQGESQLVSRVAAFDHNRGRLIAGAVTTRIALAHIGGPQCIAPAPALPVVGIPAASRSGNKRVAVARHQLSQARRTKKQSSRGQTTGSSGATAQADAAVGGGGASGVGSSRGAALTAGGPSPDAVAPAPLGGASGVRRGGPGSDVGVRGPSTSGGG